MCGIAGRIQQDGRSDPELLLSMRDAMTHRGPDDAGAWWSPDGRVGLAHRRLAILDLTAGGHQPMSDASGNWWITFNGEIYNYRELRQELEALGHHFRSASDTEVLVEALAHWGQEALSRLNGMFAFGAYDSGARTLLLARDRAGEKPLYYCHRPGRFAFASELKGLLADPTLSRQLDEAGLESLLALGYVPGEQCILRGMRKLPPAHALTYDLERDTVRVRRYWEFPSPRPLPQGEGELLERLETLLEDAVRRQLVADVPVGILLSGGVDSSLVTALAARVSSRPIRTFTVSFPGHSTLDEAPYARLVARHCGTEHTELAAEPPGPDLLAELAAQFDEPLADTSLIPTFLVSRLIRQHCTVALGGDGGDELFAGYGHYRALLRRSRGLPHSLGCLAEAGLERLPLGLKGRNYLLNWARNPRERMAHVGSFFDARSRSRLLAPFLAQGRRLPGRAEAERAASWRDEWSVLRNATHLDFTSYLVDDILAKVDRASMKVSLEVRAPWLDYRILEFAFGEVPDQLKATARDIKILPKRLARKLLPGELDLDRKQGFSPPMAAWLKGSWGDFAADVLAQADGALWNKAMVGKLLAGLRQGLSHSARIFLLVMFELWRRQYGVQAG